MAPASCVAFSHKSMWGLFTARGTFTGITGEAHITDAGYVTGTLTVDAESLTTKYDRLTTHLLSADFFDVANHPTIDFVAHCVGPDGPDRATVNGHLTILGTTQHISFPVRTRLEHPNEVAVTGSTKVNRNDYGMSFDKLRASRGLTTVAFSLALTRGESHEYLRDKMDDRQTGLRTRWSDLAHCTPARAARAAQHLDVSA